MEGILNIHKPPGPTSHDIVARVRKLLRVRRVGHAGTLDPAAEGVLVLFVGQATRLIEFTADADKEYVGEVVFGVATTTLDAEGEVTATADASHLTREQVEAVLPRFSGEIEQVPPMYSAAHHQGRRLYELARRGEEVERKPRRVTIHVLEVLDFVPGAQARARVRVVCSKGTYIRSLAADLGAALPARDGSRGLPAHLASLTRTRVGPFRIEDAVSLAELAAATGQSEPTRGVGASLDQHILPARAAVAHLPAVVVAGETLARVCHGNSVPLPSPTGEGPVRIETPEGDLVGVGRCERAGAGWRLRPEKVLKGDSIALRLTSPAPTHPGAPALRHRPRDAGAGGPCDDQREGGRPH
ncbi:MAG: tRNA pseudouridine(55) synthase TruB [Armatimonadetes bacterium]|nr:tRNA pseudouridine(55) synthase TruB [Armatimonadota bacterium]